MQNLISFLMVIIIFENLENFSLALTIKNQKCPLKGQLCLAGYAQSSVPGELTHLTTFRVTTVLVFRET